MDGTYRASVLGIVALLACGACGSRAAQGEEAPADTGGGETAETTAAAGGVTGTVGGEPWRAMSAVAGSSITGEGDRNVVFYAVPVTCEELQSAAPEGGRDVSVTVTWTDGWTTSPAEGSFERSRMSASEAGSVTVVRATTAPGPGARIRIEMQGEDPSYDSISGEIDVVDCGPSQSVRAADPVREVRLALAR